MLHTDNKIIKHKTGLLNLAEELGNVSKACPIKMLNLKFCGRSNQISRQANARPNQGKSYPDIGD